MKRVENWSIKLAEAIAHAEVTPFEWGTFDCGYFGADVVQSITGEDHMGDLRGAYHDAESAKAAIKAAGHWSLYHFLLSIFDHTTHWFEARRGYLVLGKGEGGPAIGVVEGEFTAFLGSVQIDGTEIKQGLVRVKTRDQRHFFKVG